MSTTLEFGDDFDADFARFQQFLIEDDTRSIANASEYGGSIINECLHEDVYEDEVREITVCKKCSISITRINHGIDKKTVSHANFRSIKNDEHYRKSFGSVAETFTRLNIIVPDAIIAEISIMFNRVIEKRFHNSNIRAGNRRGLLGACMFYYYCWIKQPIPTQRICTMFGIQKNKMSMGQVGIIGEIPLFRTKVIEVHELFPSIVKSINFEQVHVTVLEFFYKNVKKFIESFINKCSPTSIACGVVFSYVTNMFKREKIAKTITIQEFAQQQNLSEITINKIANEINKNLQ